MKYKRIILKHAPKVKLTPMDKSFPPIIVDEGWWVRRFKTRRGLLYDRVRHLQTGQVIWLRLVPVAEDDDGEDVTFEDGSL